MERVVSLEKSRIRRWLTVFFIAVGSILCALCVSLGIIAKSVMEMHSLDMFELFGEDPEIIRDFFWEVIRTFIEELPQSALVIACVSLFLAGAILFTTKGIRSVISRKRKQLEKYR